MPFIRKPVKRYDRWIEFSLSILGVQWSLIKFKILILLYMNEEMTTNDIAWQIKKTRSFTSVYLSRLIYQGKVVSRFQELTNEKMYSINRENQPLMVALGIIVARYGNRLKRQEPFSRPKIKERHPRIRIVDTSDTSQHKKGRKKS